MVDFGLFWAFFFWSRDQNSLFWLGNEFDVSRYAQASWKQWLFSHQSANQSTQSLKILETQSHSICICTWYSDLVAVTLVATAEKTLQIFGNKKRLPHRSLKNGTMHELRAILEMEIRGMTNCFKNNFQILIFLVNCIRSGPIEPRDFCSLFSVLCKENIIFMMKHRVISCKMRIIRGFGSLRNVFWEDAVSALQKTSTSRYRYHFGQYAWQCTYFNISFPQTEERHGWWRSEANTFVVNVYHWK